MQIATALHEREPRQARLARLARLDAVEQMLPVIAGALDVRDVFHSIVQISRDRFCRTTPRRCRFS